MRSKLLKYVKNQNLDIVRKSIKYIPESIKYAKILDQEICNFAVNKNKNLIFFIPSEYLTDELIISALSSISGDYQSISKFPQKYLVKAVENNPSLIKYIINYDHDLALQVIKKDGSLIKYIKNEIVDFELCKLAIQNSRIAIYNIPCEYFSDDLFEYYLDIYKEKCHVLNDVDAYVNISDNLIEKLATYVPKYSKYLVSRLSQNILIDLCKIKYALIEHIENPPIEIIENVLNNNIYFDELIAKQAIKNNRLDYLIENGYYKLLKYTNYEPDDYIKYIKIYQDAILYIPDQFITNEIFFYALCNRPSTVYFLCEHLTLEILEKFDDIQKEQILNNLPDIEIKLDENILQKYCRLNTNVACIYMSLYPELCDEKILCLADWFNINYNVLKKINFDNLSYDFCKYIIINKCPQIFSYLPKKYIDYEMCYTAVKHCGNNIRFVKSKYRDFKMINLAMEENMYNILYIRPDECDYQNLIQKFIDNAPGGYFDIYRYINKDFITNDVLRTYVMKNVKNLMYADQTLEICKLAIKFTNFVNNVSTFDYNFEALKYIKNKNIKKYCKKYLAKKYVKFLNSME